MPISPKQSQLGQKPQGASPQGKPPQRGERGQDPRGGLGQNTELPEKTPPPNQEPRQPQDKEKKTPAQDKNDTLKYEMQYVNGGFNNGSQIKPNNDGKALVEISIYGGGKKKTLTVGPLPPQITKLVKAYEISAKNMGDSPEITGELQKYFDKVNTKLSRKIIQILMEADHKVLEAIKSTFKGTI